MKTSNMLEETTIIFPDSSTAAYNVVVITDNTKDKALNLVSFPDLVSDEVRLWFQTINFAIICELIDVIGSLANIINIICFIKQGFKSSVNVSLLGLAISDLGCLVTLIWLNLCFNELFHQADLPFESIEVQYLTGGWPHVIFSRLTSWITAFITFERCLCITIPLKVKTMITSARVAVIMILIFLIVLATIAPVYYANRLAFKFYPTKNRTLLGLIHTSDRESVEKVAFPINNMLVPYTAFLAVIICTVTLVAKLHSKTKWRQQSTAAGKADTLSTRDQKVAQMVVMISTLFIICFTPVTIIFVAMTIWPELSIDGRYKNVFFIVFSFALTLESANSSMNICIYYRMSSKYREAFRRLFRLDVNSGDRSSSSTVSSDL